MTGYAESSQKIAFYEFASLNNFSKLLKLDS